MKNLSLANSICLVRSNVTAVVLAGGLGSRLQAVQPFIPKPLIPVFGRPFLHWVTAYIARHGIRDLIFSTGYRSDQIEAWSRDASWPELTRRTCKEMTALGTGGGLLNCIDLCHDWILVTNGDSICLGGLADLLALTGKHNVDAGIIGVFRDDMSRYGSLVVNCKGRLSGFNEKKSGRGYVNGGIYLFRKSILQRFQRGVVASIEYDFLPTLLETEVSIEAILVHDAPFIDIGTPDTLVEAETFIAQYIDHFS